MEENYILQNLLRQKIIAIVRGVRKEQIQKTADAIIKGGISCLEIAIDHTSPESVEQTYEMIRCLKETFAAGICLGAGTVLSGQEVKACVEAGAEYIISPNKNPDVIRKTKEAGKISIPGALTPTEMTEAWEAGADIVKLFPAGILGLDYIKAVRGPLKHIPVSAVGGVTPGNCRDFIEAGCSSIGVGGNLVDLKKIELGDYDSLTKTALDYVRNLQRQIRM
ncbi:bifunctional 4-hydroxy-2-oxoglutarate aldolase/2-dehydro-3-deoxy-phosphogluconate aldolase [Diplocloster agilis]|uniref:Bifunctional 4-hydroxy-2-oxoglutarate aldolase/2-dehydro-3-deoxy-phosphogluconate aldolase n=1 Tax=Diplocloster agilis TaxID=2850323 RepID=A0A949K491_9FIRM|nr:bifunctional 4-hydroxy-2-oxoglutarate aldolase/2-dehydro-3-deoxy-phosphogluconate aldolase [Diplocloster agilis]MBU9739167.1 bifunctional 4-hydroxy-2-oxoglutarate aldolase/2-dehydro-3-deoxy-phosphogluconate aldolase [Diplocloster agilis]